MCKYLPTRVIGWSSPVGKRVIAVLQHRATVIRNLVGAQHEMGGNWLGDPLGRAGLIY